MRFFLFFTCFFFINTLQAQNNELATLSANTKQYLWKQENRSSGSKILPECVYRQDAN
ncbi:MAG: Unknown protein, partial [uncultured Sulfurovum sp.]